MTPVCVWILVKTVTKVSLMTKCKTEVQHDPDKLRLSDDGLIK
jgi:hypothetical protein